MEVAYGSARPGKRVVALTTLASRLQVEKITVPVEAHFGLLDAVQVSCWKTNSCQAGRWHTSDGLPALPANPSCQDS